MSQEPLVSIVFRSRNEGKSLISLLPLLFSQKTNFPFEIILQENSSTDQTLQIIKHYPQLRVVNIPSGQFHPSNTTMEGAKIARGEILVHLSAHCFPTSFFWLQNLAQPLLDDSVTIAAYGRQFTDPNVNAYEDLDYRELFFPKTGEPKIKTFSNANGAIRKKYLLEYPFDNNVTSMEDHLWFLEIADKSKIVYVPQAEVLHLHPLFNLKYYLARWQRGGRARFYVTKIKNLTSPLLDPKQFNEPLSASRIISFLKTSFILFHEGLYLYGLMAPIFYFLRDWSWKKGWTLSQKEYASKQSSIEKQYN